MGRCLRHAPLALAVVAGSCGGGESEPEPVEPAPAPRPWSVQLHVHGSFSEGLGSIDSASHAARAVGLDALWWSDHDWRIAGQHVLSRFSFEDGPLEHDRLNPELPAGPSSGSGTAALAPVAELSLATGEVRLSSERAFDGERSYQVSAASLSPDFQSYVALLDAPEPGYHRPLAAGLALEFALWIEGAGEDGRVWLEAQLSQHPDDLAGLVLHRVRYVVGGPAGEPAEPWREGPILWVPLAGVQGQWRSYRAELSADVVRGFPEVVGLDNSLTALSLGLAVRDGEALTAFLDDVRIEAELRGNGLFARQAEVLASVAERYPDLAQHQGVEISYLAPHLNELSVGTELLDYGALALECGLLDGETGLLAESSSVDAEAFGAFVAASAVELAHAREGLVIFNHPLGLDAAESAPRRAREDVLAELLAHGLYGADLLEVGYRDRGGHPLRNHLWLWDQLALEGGLYPVGIGTSDHHGGPESMAAGPNNFVTWVHAVSPGELDLLEGLRAGRVTFGDPARFQGTLELATDHGHVMGQIVLTDRLELELEIAIDGLAATDRVIVVETGELARYLDAGEAPFRARQALELPEGNAFVRVEVLARDGAALVCSNPIHFVRAAPAGGLDPARGAFDVGGVQSFELDGFRLKGATATARERSGVQLEGTGSGGTLVFDCPGYASVAVELKGLQGKVEVAGTRVSIRYLRGAGRILVRDGG